MTRERGSSNGTAGMTLVELLVVMVLGTVIAGATYQLLLTNQRVYTLQREQVADHGTVRAGLEVLSGELREISPPGGDLLDIAPTSVEVRTMRALGFICLVDSGVVPPRFTLRPVGGSFGVDNQVLIFADGNPARGDDDGWLEGAVTNVAVGAQCPDGSGDRIRLTVLGLGPLTQSNMVHQGAPIRSFQTHRYGLLERDGENFLGRQTDGGSWEPLVGPLEDGEGLLLEYFDRNGDPTTQPTAVQRIDVSLRTLSEARDSAGNQLAHSLTTSIYTRN